MKLIWLLAFLVGWTASSFGQSSCIWTGALDSAWENPANWSCNKSPDTSTDVYINKGYCQLTTDAKCKSLTVNPAAVLKIAEGIKINVLGSPGEFIPAVNQIERTIDKIEMMPGSRPFLVPSVQALALSINQTFTITAEEINVDSTIVSAPILQWLSSDENIATVTNGLVTAKKSGTATITLSDNFTNRVAIALKVDPAVTDIDEPVAIHFAKPTALAAVDSIIAFTYVLRTNKGSVTNKPIQLIGSSASGQFQITNRTYRFTMPGVYNVFARYNGKRLRGEQVVIVFPKLTAETTFLVDTVTRVSSVDIQTYPWYFTATGVESDTITAQIVRTRLEKQGNGRYKMYYSISVEKPDNVSVSHTSIMVPNNGTIVSVAPGRAEITAVKEGVPSPPRLSTVSMEYRGIWNLIDATDGREGQLYVLSYPAKAIHSAYEQNAFAAADPGFGQFVPTPQEVTSTIKNTLQNITVCNGGGAIGFADYCIFACDGIGFTGKFAPGEIIGGLRACDGHNGQLHYRDDISMAMRTENGQDRVYSRMDVSKEILGYWKLVKHYERDNETGDAFTDFPTGEFINYSADGTFTGVIDGSGSSSQPQGKWKVLDDNTEVYLDSPGNFVGPFTLKVLNSTNLELYANNASATIILDFIR